MYAKINKDWMLRGWTDMPRVLANWRTGKQHELTPAAFYVAQSCDGQTDFDSFAFLPDHQAVLRHLLHEHMAVTCRKGDAVEPWQHYRLAKNPRLPGIHWCVTGFCNLNCRHCYMQAPSGRYGELPFKTAASIIEQFQRANVIEVSLTGGEPFLRKDLLDIIGLLTQKKIRLVQIYSNGLLITDAHLGALKQLGIWPAFQISFDGVGAHDQMRGTQGTEPKVVKAIHRLREADFAVVVATSIDRLNIGSLPQTYELMKQLKVQSWRISPPQPTGNWRGTTTATSLGQQVEVCLPLAERWCKDGKPFAIQLGALYRGARETAVTAPGMASSRPAGKQVRARARPPAGGHTPDEFDCGGCREQPNLLPDGTLVPCPGYVDSILQGRMPNILKDGLSRVWRKSFVRKIADLRKRDLLKVNPECATCSLFAECGIGCRASALTETGDLMAKDPLACELCKQGYRRRFEDIVEKFEIRNSKSETRFNGQYRE